ncbi:MAG: ribosome maturation factor RimP [Proteobacteria bacterium]|nr:ribosome maturation factor RimP [Pseudomonadota bacterium]MBU1737624.1 ribosome maturation factor RimP [Pseudomonadota bacterium]
MNDQGLIYKDHVEQQIAELAEPVLIDMGYELVEVQFRREAHGHVLRLIICHENGIGVDDCARVSREVSILLDVEDLLKQAYTLEVSSPGLDRPLTTGRDFTRNLGKKVKLLMHDDSDELVGTIRKVQGETVVIESNGREQEVALTAIRKARLVIEF